MSEDALGQGAPVGLVHTDASWRIQAVNDTFAHWTNRATEELLGTRLPTLLTVGSQMFVETHVDPLIRMQHSVRELVLELAGDPTFPVLLNADIRDGQIRAALVDIRDRRRYEKELQQARQRAEAAAARHALLAKIGPRLVTGTRVDETAQVAVEEAVPRLADGCLVHMAGQGSVQVHAEHAAGEHLPPEGLRQQVLASGEAVLEPPGSRRPVLGYGIYPLQATATFGTITFLWRSVAADPKPDLLREYADLVALALDRARTHQEAVDAVSAREAVLDVMAHEFANPLNAARLQVEMWREQGSRPEQVAPVLAVVESSVTRMQLLVRDITDMARIRGGSLGLETRVQDVVRVVEGAVELVGPTLATKGVEVRVDGAASAQAPVDGPRIEQVVMNLLSNAAKYGSSPVEVDVSTTVSWLRITVRDHGPGVPPEAQDTIFQRFRRLDSRPVGTGLGLYVVRHIVDAHGGRVWYEDAPGGGAQFVVELPADVRTLPRGA